MSHKQLRKAIKAKYGQAASEVLQGRRPSCCSAGGNQPDPITSDLYSGDQITTLPQGALLASLGCGNPSALASLRRGEVVLDLGSGGGADVFFSARQVGESGKVYGLDMSEEMVRLARLNQTEAGLSNVEFLQGEIENVPLPDESVDVVISNCVINLSSDKQTVLQEAFRVLRPGGRLAVSDVVTRGETPQQVRRNLELWIGCLAGALDEREYRRYLHAAGFTAISLEPTRVYRMKEAREFLTAAGIDAEAIVPLVEGQFMAAFIRARKPDSGEK